MNKVKNIIFDLGNVILDINTSRSETAFANYGLKNFENLYTLAAQSELFDRLEVGNITPKEFYAEFRELTGTHLSDDIIKDCWNALILDYEPKRIKLLKQVKPEYRTFILSNTNKIHYDFYTDLIKKTQNIDGLESLVEKAYFSHELNLKKPGREIFHYVLQDSNLIANETIFIDDNKPNIITAYEMGFKTVLLEDTPLEELEIFRNI
ncbi:MAG: HAD family phosphatase [Bacteroidales bacterium]|jgi:putative hydrolase of the HAD superfamily|nr:HAD family phosphatase [Bacteroidales bacterium]MDD4218219.1 HAD family phosphatase [Bacteroidales bacterium]MDY0142982.1 HAD family phosphatase [Bacteroidales bacterium]